MAAITNCPYCGVAVSDLDTVCSNCFWDLRQESAQPLKTTVTMVQREAASPAAESHDDFASPPPAPPPPQREPPRESKPVPPLTDRPKKTKPQPPPAAKKSVVSPTTNEGDTALPFRPRLRRPMAILRIYDDDGKDAEVVRIRTMDFTLGRDEGDVTIPQERLMSGKHARISCKFLDRHYRWFLTDLESTNGTFLKVQSGKLQPNSEFMLGSFRYRLHTIQQGEPEQAPEDAPQPQGTLAWKKVTAADLVRAEAALIRITPSGEGDPIPLSDGENFLGSDAGQSSVVVSDDPMLSSRHSRIYQDEHRRWFIEDLNSRNGVWLAIKQQELDKSAQFQLGEQRFGIRFP